MLDQYIPSRTETRYPHQQLIGPVPEWFAGNVWPEITAGTIRETNLLLQSAREKFKSEFQKLRAGKLLSYTDKTEVHAHVKNDPYLAAAKLCRGRIPHLGLDNDGTLNFGFTPDISREIPGSVELEACIKGTVDIRKWIAGFVQFVRPHLQDSPKTFFEVGRKVKLRPGVPKLFEFCTKHGIAIEIFSRQFEHIVHGELSVLPQEILDRISVHAITPDDITSAYKGVELSLAAARNGGIITAAGDSKIDLTMFGPTKRDMVAFFVLKGSVLHQELHAGIHPITNNIPTFPFRDGHDILNHIKAIGRRGDELNLTQTS